MHYAFEGLLPLCNPSSASSASSCPSRGPPQLRPSASRRGLPTVFPAGRESGSIQGIEFSGLISNYIRLLVLLPRSNALFSFCAICRSKQHQGRLENKCPNLSYCVCDKKRRGLDITCTRMTAYKLKVNSKICGENYVFSLKQILFW